MNFVYGACLLALCAVGLVQSCGIATHIEISHRAHLHYRAPDSDDLGDISQV